jgi:hypothetical protein
LIKGNIWTGYESYLVDVPPFTIKITETIFDPFYEYFFDEEFEESKEKTNKNL